jgi:O-antigen ligase
MLFAAFMVIRIAFIYLQFLRGGGDTLVGIRIPVFDGPTLSAVVFTALLALCVSEAAADRSAKLLWISLSAASYLLVLVCFRRTFWVELGIGTLFLFVVQRRGRAPKLLLGTLVIAMVTAILGPTFIERVRSLDFSEGDSEFSQGNPDHVGEVLDAWEQVERHPLMGIGLGRSFQTLRVQTWKEESVMVHNAPLHVWLKYGLLGLMCYVWFHFALLRWLWRIRGHDLMETMRLTRLGCVRPGESLSVRLSRRRTLGRSSLAGSIASAVLAYLAAQFIVSLGFAPWPYSSVQSTTLIAFALAMAMAGARLCNFQPSR